MAVFSIPPAEAVITTVVWVETRFVVTVTEKGSDWPSATLPAPGRPVQVDEPLALFLDRQGAAQALGARPAGEYHGALRRQPRISYHCLRVVRYVQNVVVDFQKIVGREILRLQRRGDHPTVDCLLQSLPA